MQKFTIYKILASALIGVFISASTLAGTAVVETNVSSSANTGGNTAVGSPPSSETMAGESGSVKTGNASASASVKTETNDGEATTTVKATAEANGEKKEIAEVFTGDGEISIHADVQASSTGVNYESGIVNYGDNEEIVDEDKVEITRLPAPDGAAIGGQENVAISRIVPADEIGQRILERILSALNKTFAYVVSFFRF